MSSLWRIREKRTIRHPHRFLSLSERYPTCFLSAWFILTKLCGLKATPLAFDHHNPLLSLTHLDEVLRAYGGLGVLTTLLAIDGICDWRS